MPSDPSGSDGIDTPVLHPFHLAFPVDDLAAAKDFYVRVLGCRLGRTAERWADFDFGGHKVSAHLVESESGPVTNPVDGDAIPARHFGIVLPWERWHQLVARLRSHGVAFEVGPRIRFEGEVGEQATAFVRDPAGNYLEFKSFRDPSQLFAR